MQNTTVLTDDSATIIAEEASPFSWGVVFAGAVAAIGTSFFLLTLGAGVGLRLVNPVSPSATFLTLGGIWFLASQAFGFAVGGYLVGRLIGPDNENTAEEEFRAAAHGLVMWALAIVAGLAIAAGAASLAGATLVGSASLPQQNLARGYLTDALFWPALNTAQVTADKAEASRILESGLVRGNSPADLDRLTHMVSQDAGISTAAARDQVLGVQAQILSAADQARRATGNAALWTAFALLFGAIISIAATISARWMDDKVSFSMAPRTAKSGSRL